MFENPRRGRQARNFSTNIPKIPDLKSSSEQIFSENCRWVPLIHACIPALNHPFKNFQGKHVALNVGFFCLFVLGLEYLQEELILNRLEILNFIKSGYKISWERFHHFVKFHFLNWNCGYPRACLYLCRSRNRRTRTKTSRTEGENQQQIRLNPKVSF